MKVKEKNGTRLVLNTRAVGQADELTAELAQNGFAALEIPVLKIKPLQLTVEAKALVETIDSNTILVFTSANSILALFQSIPSSKVASAMIAVVGDQTAATLFSFGILPSFVPSIPSAATLASELVNFIGKRATDKSRVIFFRGDTAREELGQEFRKMKEIIFEEIHVYSAFPNPDLGKLIKKNSAKISEISALTFMSSRTAEIFVDHALNQRKFSFLFDCPVVVVGPNTAETVKSLGFTKVSVANIGSAKGIVDSVKEILQLPF